MKTSRLIGLVVLSGLAGIGAIAAGRAEVAPAASVAPAAGAFTVDTVHSSLVYRIKHQNVAYHYGIFKHVAGSFNLDASNPEAGSLELTVKADSIDSGNEKRDGHLKSQDFFSSKEFPEITFKSKSVKKTGDAAFEVTGDLTLRGVTKPVTAVVDLVGVGPGRTGEVGGIESKFTIKRSDFGMNYMAGKGLSDEVDIIVSLEGARG